MVTILTAARTLPPPLIVAAKFPGSLSTTIPSLEEYDPTRFQKLLNLPGEKFPHLLGTWMHSATDTFARKQDHTPLRH